MVLNCTSEVQTCLSLNLFLSRANADWTYCHSANSLRSIWDMKEPSQSNPKAIIVVIHRKYWWNERWGSQTLQFLKDMERYGRPYHLRVYCTCDSLDASMSNVHSCCSTPWKFGIFIDQLSQIVLLQSMLQFMSLEFWEAPLGCDLDLLLQICPTLLLWGTLWSLIHRCGDWMLVILHELRLEGSISTSGRCRL